METIVFLIAAVIILTGAVGVIASRNPVHAALSLVRTLFGIDVLFVAQEAHFLAVVQIIVYAGAIVVLFLFVIMLLGVDQVDDLDTEPLAGQRPGAVIAFAGLLGMSLIALFLTYRDLDVVTTGRKALSGPLSGPGYNNITRVAESLFTDYLFAFEITSVLLVIAVVAAVTLAKRGAKQDDVEVES